MRGHHHGFDSLSGDKQREVWRLADVGQLHPDPTVASMSVQWAETVTAGWSHGRLVRRGFAEIVSLVLFQSTSAEQVYNERAMAKAILKAQAVHIAP